MAASITSFNGPEDLDRAAQLALIPSSRGDVARAYYMRNRVAILERRRLRREQHRAFRVAYGAAALDELLRGGIRESVRGVADSQDDATTQR